ncbi:histidinol dehydrogenase [Paracoccus pantotrophus]|nr:histidinol dehydrogenase [Paracoccus pantotrophus]MDF3856542.1 histidinol dehydrogenase [Paracoccus pantotrophus]
MFRVGGAQAIAAMACDTQTVPGVDMGSSAPAMPS